MRLTWSRTLQLVVVVAVATAGAVFVVTALLSTSLTGEEPAGKLSPRADLTAEVSTAAVPVDSDDDAPGERVEVPDSERESDADD